MARSSRPLLRVTIVAGILLVITGVWFYRAYFTSTNTAIRHAESFLFRRLSVAQLAGQSPHQALLIVLHG